MAGTLVIHPGALGDVLLAVPALRALRPPGRAGRLVLAGQPRIARLLRDLGIVDEAVDFEGLGLSAFFVEDGLPGEHRRLAAAERVVCWFGAGDAGFVRRLRALAPAVVIAAPAGEAVAVWHHLRLSIGAPAEGDADPLVVPASILAEGRHALLAAGWDGITPVLMLHPGAGGAGKRWPVDGFERVARALCEGHRLVPVVHSGPADGEAARALAGHLGPAAVWLEEPALPALAGALGHAALYLGNDSGVSHLAAAVGAPAVALFTEPHLRWRPWSAAARVVVVSTVALRAGDVEEVAAALRALLV